MKKSRIATLVCVMALSSWAMAQTPDDPSVQYDNTVVADPGDTGVLVGGGYTQDTSGGEESVADGWDVDFSADASFVDSIDAEVLNVFDGTWTSCLGNTSVTFAANQQYTCNMVSPGVIRVILENTGNDPLDSQTIGDFFRFNVDIAAGAPEGEQIDFVITNHQPATISGGAAVDMAAGTFGDANQDGQITISGPALDFNPDSGTTVDTGSAEVGSATPGATIDVTEAGTAGDDVTLDSCAIMGTNAADFSFTFTSTDVGDGLPATFTGGSGETGTINVECTPSGRETRTAQLDCSVEDDTMTETQTPSWPLTCAGLAPNVQLPGPITINGTVAGSDPTGTLTVTNPQDGFTSTANDVTASEGTGAAQITVTSGGPEDIVPDGSFDFQVSCDSSSEGSFVRTIDFAWDNPDPAGPTSGSVDVTCNVSDVAPIYESDPAVGTMLSMSADFGMQSAPTGLDVRNANPNTDADDLVISSASADDPVFSVTVNQTTFPGGGSFDGVDDIEVTCTPEGVGTVNGTLTVETNDPNEPADGFQYPLECVGTGDVVTTSPDDGGTLNLGTVLPGNTTGEGFIDFTNNGIQGNGSVDVSCQLTDPDGVMTATTPLSFAVSEGTTESAGFECTPPEIGSFSADLSCDLSGATTGTATFSIVCAGRPLIVPTLSQWGLLIMMLTLLTVGGFAARRVMG